MPRLTDHFGTKTLAVQLRLDAAQDIRGWTPVSSAITVATIAAHSFPEAYRTLFR